MASILRLFRAVLGAVSLAGALTGPAAAGLILSEIKTNNAGSLLDEDGDSPDWIELHNDGEQALDLGGHFLTDDPEDLNKWELPALTLEAGGYLVVFASGKDRRVPAGEMHTNFQLKNGGEYLGLVGPDKTTVLDAFDPQVPQLDEEESVGVRKSSGAWVLHFFSEPTPGAANAGGTVGEKVFFSVEGRPFVDSLEIALSTRSGSPITYTTDGKKPSLFNGKTYTGPLVLTETTILTASISRGPLTQEIFFQVTPALAETTSNLPLVIVESGGVIGTSYGGMLLGILEPAAEGDRTRVEGAFSLNGRGEIRTRGSSTQAFPKKSYRLEFQDAEGEDKVRKPFGMPAESDWILSGRYEEDRTLIRNEFTYEVARQMGQYAARTRFCEVYVSTGDGPVGVEDYVGVYSFMEAIKRDADRIDIEELTPDDNEAPAVTGGYIFKVDRAGPNDTVTTGGGQSIVITEPARGELTDAQLNYLRNYLNEMAAALDSSDPETGYPAYIDEGSWVDHHLVNMLMLNVDALRLSTFFYKERDGKVFGGPVWDFNISSGSRDRFGSPPRPSRPDVWRGISGDRGTTFFTNGTQRWWGSLFSTRDFQQAYTDRWQELRAGVFSTENLHGIIDGMVEEIGEAQARNQARWPEVAPEYGGWQGEIDHLKDWLATRVEWVDKELVAPPAVTPGSGALAEGETIRITGKRGTLFAPTTLYYTLDGSDPRLPGGEINPDAIAYSGPFTPAASAHLVTREYLPNYQPKPDGPQQQWSAPARAQFILGMDAAAVGNLVISEIMYHPANPSEAEIAAGFSNDDAFEFLEFTNIGAKPINLLGVTATEGIDFLVAAPLVLEPGASTVIVSHLEAFRHRYGEAVPVAGVYSGRLANAGERLAFADASGETIVEFRYDDNDPWPSEADGDGFSLVLLNHGANPDPNDVANWTLSEPGGTPGVTGESQPPVGLPYLAWAAQTIPAGRDASREVDLDLDGRPNLMEYAQGTDPIVSDGAGAWQVGRDATGVFVTYLRRTTANEASISVQLSEDLVRFEKALAAPEKLEDISPEVVRLRVRMPAATGGYARLGVE